MKYITLIFTLFISITVYSQSRTVIMSGTPVTVNNNQKIKFSNDTFIAEDATESTDTALGLWDFWIQERPTTTLSSPNGYFLGSIFSAGSMVVNTTAPIQPYAPHGVLIRKSTTANSGYSIVTGGIVSDYFGGISHKMRFQLDFRLLTNVRFELGYLDKANFASAIVDGAYFTMTNSVISCVTANNSVLTTNATTFTAALNTLYTFDIEVNQAGTAARFRIYAGNNKTPVYDQTNTTNIPTTSTRAFGAGMWIWESTTAAITPMICLYSYGIGTVAGFNKTN